MTMPTVSQHFIDYIIFALVRFLELVMSILPSYDSFPLPDWSLAPMRFAGNFLAFIVSPFGGAGDLALTAFQYVLAAFFWLFPLWIAYKIFQVFRAKPEPKI